MRLKKLELFGFKSFADRTEIAFDEGVTCVVGPNGCGKSNISDAIRWVLGERSAKLLRGSRMEDVIFSGTDHRKPVALAEVSLTIDNTDRGLPIDYQEVTIARRLYRSGESEYLINRTLCRLKDIQDLILDTGIGSNSYSMIEQGRIDYILNADADERRFLIEEAAGISKFKIKKEEAIRKLGHTEENLLRLKDIISEVHKNIQYAERQARRAERYKEQFEKLKRLEIQKAFYDLNGLGSERQHLEAEQSLRRSENEALLLSQSEYRKVQEFAGALLREILERYSGTESKRYGVQSKMEQAEQQLHFHQEKRIELATRRGEIQQEKSELTDRISASEKEIAAKQTELDQLGTEKEGASDAVQRAEGALREIEEELQSARSFLEQTKPEFFELASATTQARNAYHRLLAILETSGERKQRQGVDRNRFEQEAAEWESRKGKSEKDIDELEERISRLGLEKMQQEEKLKSLAERQKTLHQEIDRLGRGLHEKETRLNLLLEIDSVRGANEEALFAETEGLEKNLIKTLREIFTVKAGYEWALEAALGTFAHSVVIESIGSAEKLLSHIEEKKIPSLGLLIRETAKPHGAQKNRPHPKHPCVRNALREVIEVAEGYEDLFASFFNNVYIVEKMSVSDLKDLLLLAEDNKFLTPEGFILGPERRIFFHHGHDVAEHSYFKRGAELESLRNLSVELQDLIHQKKGDKESLDVQSKKLASEFETLEASRLDALIQKESFEQLRSGIEERLAALKREFQLNDFESQEIQNYVEEAAREKKKLESELMILEGKECGLRQRQELLLRDIEVLDRGKEQALKDFAQLKARFENLDDRGGLVQESLSLLVDHDRRDRERIRFLGEETIRIAGKEQSLLEEDKRLAAELNQLEEKVRTLDVALELIRQEKEKAQAELASHQDKLQEMVRKQQNLQEKMHQVEIKIMDLGYQEKAIGDRLQQAYHVTMQELRADDFPLAGDLEEIETVIDELRGRMDSLGTVNLLAIEEYEEMKQRYDFLMSQQKDLEEAHEQLLEAIRKINRTTKGLFEETFALVQKTFQEYYQILFRGGEARLVLVDESNPLESGIDIVVRPPGKKLQHITLLSGGEKALTAIALLFALFKIKPSPFCVLDEVDAPLDEANIDRFLSVLRTFLDRSQFIITTHNRKTIAMGDSLYGVTMQEAGVSKIVSVKVKAEATSFSEMTPEKENPIEDQVTA